MPTPVIVPAAKALYLCDNHIGYNDGKVDLYGLFNAIAPENGYPHSASQFCVFAQLVNGLGKVPFLIDVRHAPTDQLIHTTGMKTLFFPDRIKIVQMVVVFQGLLFERPGLYLLELFCDNTWVCDAPLLLQ